MMKVLGVVIALATLTSLLVGTAVPASAAAPGALAWAVTDTPSNVGAVLGGKTAAGVGTDVVDVNFMIASADGKAVFAWDDTAKLMYKSTNGGATWGTPAAIALGAAVSIAISPNYATDSTVAIADATNVWWSTNGGASFVNVANADLTTKLAGGGTITSIDLGYYYANNTLTILAGIANVAAAATSQVIMFQAGGFTWTAVGLLKTGDVMAVAFSKSHLTDAELLCVYNDPAVGYILSSKFGALAWGNAAYPNLTVLAGVALVTQTVKIGIGSDYVGNTGAPILIGIAGFGTAADNLYRVTGRVGVAGAASRRDVIAIAPIKSIAIIGPAATANVVVGIVGSAQVYRSTTVTATTTTWTAATKPPTGLTANVAAVGAVILVGTTGADSAVSVSSDTGATFNQLSLIDVGLFVAGAYTVSLIDLTVVDANTMFLVMGNTAGALRQYVFKTTDAGVTWQRIYTTAVTIATPLIVKASPAYATDATVVISDGSATIYKSVNGGASFSLVGTPAAAVTSLFVLDTNSVYVGTALGVYKVGRWAISTGIAAGAGNVVSIALNPKDTTKATFMVGMSLGTVYESTNDCVSFTRVGAAGPGAAGTLVAYGPDATKYAVDSAAGAYRWTGTAWLSIQAATGSGLAVTADGSLYMASNTAGVGIWRSLKPTATTAALCEFQALAAPTFASWTAAYIAVDLESINTATANNLYAVETTTGAGTSYLYAGRVYGFSDTLIAAAKTTAPASAALLTTTTTAAASWPAVTGATGYFVTMDGVESAATTAVAVTLGSAANAAPFNVAPFNVAMTPGSSHTWSVRVCAPAFSRTSATLTFTVALAPVGPGGPAGILPTNGGVDVAIDSTFSWPVVAGATSYEFVIAEDLGNTDPFAIIDYSATSLTNAHKLRENLKYNTTYYWRVRPVNATTKGDWTVGFFTTVKAPVPVTTPPTTPPVVITSTPPPQITLEIPPSQAPVNVIPSYLLWAVIAVGAVLIIVVIVLIVRTRRIS